MKYDIKGKFFEACDCEVICSCWIEVEPVMGQCTGMFVWNLGRRSTINGIDVAGCKLATIAHGQSCDDGEQMLVVIDPGSSGTPEQRDGRYQAIRRAFLDSAGPWNQVFDFPPSPVLETVEGRITLTNQGNKTQVSISQAASVTDRSIEGIAFGLFNTGIKLDGNRTAPLGKTPLIKRVPGRASKRIETGHIELGPSPAGGGVGVGLSLLADVFNGGKTTQDQVPDYRFDLDLTTVTAMRGSFHYTLS